MLLIGTPMCKRFSSWQYLNDTKRDPETVEREKVKAKVHLAFMCELYHAQVNAGRYFLHEHPGNATSWQEECIEEVMDRQGVEVSTADRCQYGQQEDGLPIKKPTKFMSNSEEILRKLAKRCAGRDGWCSRKAGGRHKHAEGSTTSKTEIFTFQLCKAILQGFRRQ